MRKRIKVLIKSESPLAISEGFKGGWAVPTKEYIPGSTVRGALADYLIKSKGLTEMKKILLSPGTAVLDFNPVQLSLHEKDPDREKEILNQQVGRIIETGRLPQTVVSCKRRDGFVGETSSDGLKKHGLADSLEVILLNLLMGDKQRKGSQVLTPRCPKCHEPQKEFGGWYQLEKRGNGSKKGPFSFKGMNPFTTSYVHIGIDPDRGASAQEIFYTIDALDEDQFFLGTILADDYAEEWRNILKPKEYLFLGGGKSRGYGAGIIKVVLMDSEISEELKTPFEPLDIRCKTFTERIREKGAPIEKGIWLVPLTLLSPAILMDRFLRPVADDITRDVRDHGLPTTTKPLLVKARIQTIQGWHSATNVPKPDFLALDSGSVFVYQCPGNDQTLQALQRIEEMGIGFRKPEGFGQVRVASPLHTEILNIGKED